MWENFAHAGGLGAGQAAVGRTGSGNGSYCLSTDMQIKPQTFDRQAFLHFCQNQQRFDTGARPLLFLIPYVAGMLLFAIPIRLLDSHPAWAFVWFLAFFGYLILFPLLWMRALTPREQRHFLKCPACMKPTAPPNRLVIVATSKCGHCGETILENRSAA